MCFTNKNKTCQLPYSWFQTSQTGGQWYSDPTPFRIPCSILLWCSNNYGRKKFYGTAPKVLEINRQHKNNIFGSYLKVVTIEICIRKNVQNGRFLLSTIMVVVQDNQQGFPWKVYFSISHTLIQPASFNSLEYLPRVHLTPTQVVNIVSRKRNILVLASAFYWRGATFY